MKKRFLVFLIIFCTFSLCGHEKVEIILCEHGLEMFAHDLEFVRHANESIEIASPFLGGKIMRELVETIDKRMQEKEALQVHILAAPLFLEEQDEKILQEMKKKYSDRFHVIMSAAVPTLSPDLTAIHNHVKVFIVDEQYFAVGGTNLDEGLCTDGSYTPERKPKDKIGPVKLPAGARDGDIVGSDIGLARELRHMFFELFSLWEEYDRSKILISNPHLFKDKNRYFPVSNDPIYVPYFKESEKRIVADKVKMVFSGPWEQPYNSCSDEYRSLIANAKKKVIIGNLYFSPIESILAALKQMVNRGVQFELIANGVHEGITPEYNTNFCWANRIHYVPMFYGRDFHLWESRSASQMKQKNTHIYEYYVPDIVYHKKAMVVDEHIYVVGSYNLGRKSDIADYELILVIESEEAVHQATLIFEKEKALSIEITPERARGWYFDPFTSLLAGTQKLFHGML